MIGGKRDADLRRIQPHRKQPPRRSGFRSCVVMARYLFGQNACRWCAGPYGQVQAQASKQKLGLKRELSVPRYHVCRIMTILTLGLMQIRVERCALSGLP